MAFCMRPKSSNSGQPWGGELKGCLPPASPPGCLISRNKYVPVAGGTQPFPSRVSVHRNIHRGEKKKAQEGEAGFVS